MQVIKNKLPFVDVLAGAKARFIHTDNMTIAEWQFDSVCHVDPSGEIS